MSGMDHGFNKLLLNALVIPLVNGDGWDEGGSSFGPGRELVDKVSVLISFVNDFNFPRTPCRLGEYFM